MTLALPEKGFFTGRNPVAVSLWDWQGSTPEATVSILLLAFTPAGDEHGDSHGEAATADDHAATDDHSEASTAFRKYVASWGRRTNDQRRKQRPIRPSSFVLRLFVRTRQGLPASTTSAPDDHVAADDHAATESEHAHDGAGATEGQGFVAAPVALAPSDELGEYRGELAFDQVGTYTLSVIFTIDGEQHGAIFDVAVAQSRPRGPVLGGFALVNGLAIATAAVLKRRTPAKPSGKPARPAPPTAPTTTPEEQPR